MKTLVILAHPDLGGSRVNKRWKQELLQYPGDIAVHELYKEYPDWNIDIGREQQLLESYDRIILQCPLYWYSYPPLLKKWFDEVWTYGWAYGSTGDKLAGKAFGLALSIGDKQENYRPDGSVSFTVDEVIAPFKASLIHVGAVALPHFSFFGASFKASDAAIEQSAREYMDYIRSIQQ
ncbi:NAD(P)H-dependent oxidoreductase [Paenibacillus tepidiphilus]|uniref:NAD(P)H-dependent oxidoreductase n=1 Tax=Paenibacillus tepidiphilus TaxID=2608683 RepID=UPI001238CA5C|nr:NAD(P)H-dependent oxidoreductase [Paenibacillus tepidiphilus]